MVSHTFIKLFTYRVVTKALNTFRISLRKTKRNTKTNDILLQTVRTYEVLEVTTRIASSITNQNGERSGKRVMSSVVCGDSNISWGCVADQVYASPLPNNIRDPQLRCPLTQMPCPKRGTSSHIVWAWSRLLMEPTLNTLSLIRFWITASNNVMSDSFV
jgi:hypothetical protein